MEVTRALADLRRPWAIPDAHGRLCVDEAWYRFGRICSCATYWRMADRMCVGYSGGSRFRNRGEARMQLFGDMDGVLADFDRHHGGALLLGGHWHTMTAQTR
jgi:hypothetical protein